MDRADNFQRVFRNMSFLDLPPTCGDICILLCCSILMNKITQQVRKRGACRSGCFLAAAQTHKHTKKINWNWVEKNKNKPLCQFWYSFPPLTGKLFGMLNETAPVIYCEAYFSLANEQTWGKENYSLFSEITFAKPHNKVNYLKENHLS